MKQNLFLFTDKFPFGKGEAFIQDELNVLAKKFTKVYVLPIDSAGIARELPSNAEVIKLDLNMYYRKTRTMFSSMYLIIGILVQEFMAIERKGNYIKNFREHLSMLLQAVSRARVLEEFLIKQKIEMNNSTFYSFWFYDWATVLSILTKKNSIPEYFSRAHSYDVYPDYFRSDQIMPFRNFQLKFVKKVFPDSRMGESYLKDKYPVWKHKIEVDYLGVKDLGVNPKIVDGKLKILSCSFVEGRKRVDMILDCLLHYVKGEIFWTHIGDGKELVSLQERSKLLPSSVKVNFTGYLNKEDMMKEFQTTPFDLFLHLSELEGLPVTMINACSFGIPLVGVDAGGVREIINSETGLLLSADSSAEQVGKIINEFSDSYLFGNPFRIRVRNFWETNFNSEKNYDLFYKKIVRLN